MNGEKNLEKLLQTMRPVHNPGEYVFCTVDDPARISLADAILYFKENEGATFILEKRRADELGLEYSFVAAWITLSVHSSLEAVGLTAAFSAALAENGISCNVVAANFHDHIFVAKADTKKAMDVLNKL